jgi:peptidoglycan/xylan/chitin deacetylase (PgdA/CDA1 family)
LTSSSPPRHEDSFSKTAPVRWKPSPFIATSAALHVGAAAAVIGRPQLWPWALGAVVADHLFLTAAGLWPRSRLLGPNWIRLPPRGATGAVAITIDDGPDPEVTPRVLDILDRHSASATFFCVGERVARHAGLAREMQRRGHAIENHSQHHRRSFSLLGPQRMTAEIAEAQDCIAATVGVSPRFFRAPAGLRNPFLEPVLSRLRLRLASWTRRGYDTRSRDSDTVFDRLSNALCAGDILLLHDGNAARTRGGGPVILEVLPRLLDALAERALRPVTLRSALE